VRQVVLGASRRLARLEEHPPACDKYSGLRWQAGASSYTKAVAPGLSLTWRARGGTLVPHDSAKERGFGERRRDQYAKECAADEEKSVAPPLEDDLENGFG